MDAGHAPRRSRRGLPAGVSLAVDFALPPDSPPSLAALTLTLTYDLFDGVPLIAKRLTLRSSTPSAHTHPPSALHRRHNVPQRGTTAWAADDDAIRVDAVTVEQFAANARFGAYIGHGSSAPLVTSGGVAASPGCRRRSSTRDDQAHGAGCAWTDDFPASHDPVPGCADCHDEGSVEPLLNCSYTSGPGAYVGGGEVFVSFRALLLATDSTDMTRQTLARHRVTQLLAPHTTENPIFFHATDVSDAGFRRADDQMAEVGFEMLIFSFGSGFRFASADPAYLASIKAQIDYAESKGIEVGGYDLVCLERGYGGYGDYVGDEYCAVATTATR